MKIQTAFVVGVHPTVPNAHVSLGNGVGWGIKTAGGGVGGGGTGVGTGVGMGVAGAVFEMHWPVDFWRE